MKYTEDSLEQATKGWFWELGYKTIFGPNIEPEGEHSERDDF